MEYVAPNEDGLNSLQDYLMHTTLDLVQSLRWSIQFCQGMIYAHSKGVRCHRDIKPANVLIEQDKTVKISDFGLAGVIGHPTGTSRVKLSLHDGTIGLSGRTAEGMGFGTPTHMPPEQFTNAAACDERSDIYSFGVVLYQMATNGSLPFLAPLPSNDSEQEAARFWRAMFRLHTESPIPKVHSYLFPMIERCLEKEPSQRYQSFHELLSDLEILLKRKAGKVVSPPELKELNAREWNNKGMSLCSLGLHDEAIKSFDQSLQLNPLDALAWNNKGQALHVKGSYQDARACFQEAIRLEPGYVAPYNNMGNMLRRLGDVAEALRCYEYALELDPNIAGIWINKGDTLCQMGRHEDALSCYRKAVSLNPKYLAGWIQMGNCLLSLGEAMNASDRLYEAVDCFDKALGFEGKHWEAWRNKGGAFLSLKEYQKALDSFTKAVTLHAQDPVAWYFKAVSEDHLAMEGHARSSYLKALSLDDGGLRDLADVARRRVGELDKS